MIETNQVENKVIDTKDNTLKEQFILNYLSNLKNPFMEISPQYVSKDLHIGINQAYDLFKQTDFPTKKVGQRRKLCLVAYLLWKIDKSL